ncbi:hypothetical protein L208DRAFT_1239560 [Tricholoma matsutake]|nr:hypothetical protein L208DRAFT_1239560 [Tricholoma matsutake 945]
MPSEEVKVRYSASVPCNTTDFCCQERIVKAIEVGRTIIHYGWIPLIIYVGFTRSNPQPSLIKCVAVKSFLNFDLQHFSPG